MTATQLLGLAMIVALAAFLMWLAARDGHLKSLLQGALLGGVISLVMVTAMRLISGGSA